MSNLGLKFSILKLSLTGFGVFVEWFGEYSLEKCRTWPWDVHSNCWNLFVKEFWLFIFFLEKKKMVNSTQSFFFSSVFSWFYFLDFVHYIQVFEFINTNYLVNFLLCAAYNYILSLISSTICYCPPQSLSPLSFAHLSCQISILVFFAKN